MGNDRLEAAADRAEILEVAMTSLVCRDSGDMDGLAACFHPDALLTSSWFSGKASAFVEGARKALATRHTGDSQKHIAGNQRVSLSGGRAICEYYVTLHQRRTIDGYEFDFQTWSSFCDLFEQRDGAWRISRRWVIYEKDRMDPHKPGEVPDSYFKVIDLRPIPRRFAITAGATPMPIIRPPRTFSSRKRPRRGPFGKARKNGLRGNRYEQRAFRSGGGSI